MFTVTQARPRELAEQKEQFRVELVWAEAEASLRARELDAEQDPWRWSRL